MTVNVPWEVHGESIRSFAESGNELLELRNVRNNHVAAEIDQITRDFMAGCGIAGNLTTDPATAYIALTVSELFERVVHYMHVFLETDGHKKGMSPEALSGVHSIAEQFEVACRLASSTFLHAASQHIGLDVPRPFGEAVDYDELDHLDFEASEDVE